MALARSFALMRQCSRRLTTAEGFDVEGVTIRHAEVGDAEALHRILTGPRVVEKTLRLPYRSAEWSRRLLERTDEGSHVLSAVVENEVVGNLDLEALTVESPFLRYNDV